MEGSHLEYGLVGGLSISQALVISPLVPTVRRVIGTRPTLLLGAVLIFVSLLTASFSTKIWHLFLSQGVCFGWGMGCCYVTAAAVLPPWFTSRRSLAVGVATSGSGIGGLVYSIATNAIIEKFDVGWAYRVLAFCALGSNLLAALLLKEWRGRTQMVQEELRFDPRDFGKVELLLVIFWGLSTDLGYIILLYSLPTYAASIGLTPTQGAVSSALLNLGLALGRPSVGYFSDSFGRINMAGVMTFLCAIFCFTLWIPSQSYAPLLAFSLLAGALCGTFWGTVTPVLAEVVGIRKLASTFGVICLPMALPTTFAELVAMKMVGQGDDVGSGSIVFTNAKLFVGFMFLAGALSVWFLRCWKISKVETEQSANGTLLLAPPVLGVVVDATIAL
ncbi:hypothetical protein ACO1O0_003465 [Amphichorda felina]